MAGFNFKDNSPLQRITFNSFRGVDFSSSLSDINIARSPDSINFISDLSGYPVKRTGYHLKKQFEGTVHNIYRLFYLDKSEEHKGEEKEQLITHVGNKLLSFSFDDTEPVIIFEGMKDSKSCGFNLLGKLWIVDGLNYLVFDGYDVKDVCKDAYIPTTFISRDPATGGGTVYESVNLLNGARINSFLGTSGTTKYKLDSTDLSDTLVKAKKLNLEGEWIDLVEITDFTVDRVKGEVTFKAAPGLSPVTGKDNVTIEFVKENAENIAKIKGCTLFDIYQYGQGYHVFLAGNAKHSNFDFRCYVNNPAYFPDLGYSEIGQNTSAIMTYLKLFDAQAIVKEDNSQDYTIFIRQATMIDDKVQFTIKPGIAGVGCVSSYATASVADDPLFLSSEGVFAVASTNNTSEKVVHNRSYYVNAKLNKETNLEKAISVTYNGYLYLCVNGHCYIADSRQKSNNGLGSDSFGYEWYYWDNIPATCFFEYENNLYFGTATGEIMRFYRYDEFDIYNDNGVLVYCHWVTPYLNFGTTSQYKNLKGFWLLLNPATNSSAEIYYSTQGIPKLVKETFVDIFKWDLLDFNRFTFDLDTSPRVVSTGAKQKKFMLISFIIKNKFNEPFGFYSLEATYKVAGKYKK